MQEFLNASRCQNILGHLIISNQSVADQCCNQHARVIYFDLVCLSVQDCDVGQEQHQPAGTTGCSGRSGEVISSVSINV